MKVTIDREECTSCETCWITCPEFFEQNPGDTWSQVVAKYRTGGNPAEGDAPADLWTRSRKPRTPARSRSSTWKGK